MDLEQIKRLQKLCDSDPDLLSRIRKATSFEEFVKIAAEAGIEINPGDWVRSQASQIVELSDEELERAAGGAAGWVTVINAIAETIDGYTTATIDGPDKSGLWGSFAHWDC